MDDVAAWMRDAGLEVRRDAVGNVRGRYAAADARGPALLLGSHLDSVRDAGRYDGPLGVVAALDAVAQSIAVGGRLPCPLEVVAFVDEEGLRFQTTYLGSRALAGSFDPRLLDLRDESGQSLREAIVAFGGDPTKIHEAALRPGDVGAYVEVHIEQGPVLELVDAPVGIVTEIAGQTRVAVEFTGEAGHAGTVPPSLRRDALPAAAELVLAAEQIARQTPGLVATVGQIHAEPGVSNVIPGKARLTLDVRHPRDAARRHADANLEAFARRVAFDRALHLEWHVAQETASVHCDRELTERLRAAVAACALPDVRLASGAGHDAVIMADVLPIGMLFVRCRGGISHHPDESVRVDDVAATLDVLDRFLASNAIRLPA
jgi:allantoate deiminase